MRPIDIRIIMAIVAGIIITTSFQNVNNLYFKIAVIAFGLYLAFKSRYF